MALIGVILKKVSSDKLIVFSGAAFFVKILILLFASNLAMMYVSQSFQLFAYAVFTPAVAFYVNETMNDADQVKGQAYVYSAITVGGIFSNLLSGIILDNFGIHTMLLTGTIVCGIGAAVVFGAMNKRKAGQ
jgi:PPP family 3-phenylpropionic acid transporter